MTAFPFDALRRHPDPEADNLFAWDATDRYLLDRAAEDVPDLAAQRIAVIGDRYGALSLPLVARGAADLRVHQDGLAGERALSANAETLGLVAPPRLGLVPELVVDADLVLLQLPRGLEALTEIADLVAAEAPEATLLAGGRVKHMTTAMTDLLRERFTEVQPSLARGKSRLLAARGVRPERPASSFPRIQRHAERDLVLVAHGAAFGGTKVDPGTRLLLDGLRAHPLGAGERAVDLGCGTGLIAVTLAQRDSALSVLASDQSWAAVASAQATVEANGLAERITVTRDDALAAEAEGSADIVVLNPPFHIGATVHTGLAEKLFRAAARVLRPGGELRCVWNSPLGYRPALERLVGPTEQLARDARFTVTRSIRR